VPKFALVNPDANSELPYTTPAAGFSIGVAESPEVALGSPALQEGAPDLG
jgi:hypothetical protein